VPLGDEITSDSARWSAVNVSQPLDNLENIPDDIPVMLGSNKHEGELFVYSAFPAPMPKAVVSCVFLYIKVTTTVRIKLPFIYCICCPI